MSSFIICLNASSFNLFGKVSIIVVINSNPKHFALVEGVLIQSFFMDSDKRIRFFIKLMTVSLSQ